MARGRPWLWWSHERGRNSVIILIARNGDDSRGDPPSAANNKEDSFILSQLSALSDKCKEMSTMCQVSWEERSASKFGGMLDSNHAIA